ncbi:MAG: SPASM domain-containing protein [Clostridiales bacterium]|nr:SPASM domain-containing protein [Clostridiales bacterium]
MKRYKKIYVEITNVCNLKCNFCPLTKRAPEFMTEASFEFIVSNIKHLTDQIYFHVMGEPLLHPKLAVFLEICDRHGLKVNITTNAVLIHEAEAILLHSPAVKQVNFSLGSFEANSETLTLESYIGNITSFILKAQATTNIVNSLRLWNLDSDLIRGANTWNDKIMALLEDQLNLNFSIKENCMTYRAGKLSNNVYVNIAEKFEWPDIDQELATEKVFCYGLRDKIAILVDGTVVPCCHDSDGNINLGNIFETSIDAIIDSSRAKAMYKGFTDRKVEEELCRKCGFARKF